MEQKAFFCVSMVALILSYPAASQAQSPNQKPSIDYAQSVAERPIETYGSSSVRLGSWLLIPNLEIAETYDSNIYATQSNVVDDFITVIKPRARLTSDWSVHQVQLEVGGNFGLYNKHKDENYNDYYVRNSNRLEIVRGTDLILGALYRHAVEPRTSSNNIYAAAEPVSYDLVSGNLGIERNLSVFKLLVDTNAEKITYANSERIGGGTINNSDQDRVVLNGGAKLSYETVPGNSAFVGLRLKDVNYEDPTRNGGPDRDNWGFEILLGASKSVSDLWVVDAYLGYAPSYYADPSLNDITGWRAFSIGGNLLWNPTALTSVIGHLDRRTNETTQTGASGQINTSLSLRVEHKLTRFILLDAGLGYTYSDYYGSTREDDTYRAGLGIAYYFTRLVSVRAAYDYRERDSSQDGDSYNEHTASLQLRVNY